MNPCKRMNRSAVLWGDLFWQKIFAKTGPPGELILAMGDLFWQAKLVRPDRFWQQKWFGGTSFGRFSAKIGQGGPILGGPILV